MTGSGRWQGPGAYLILFHLFSDRGLLGPHPPVARTTCPRHTQDTRRSLGKKVSRGLSPLPAQRRPGSEGPRCAATTVLPSRGKVLFRPRPPSPPHDPSQPQIWAVPLTGSGSQSLPHLPSHIHPGGPPHGRLCSTHSARWTGQCWGRVAWGGRSRGRPARRGGLALARCYTSDSRARARRGGGGTAHLGPEPLQARLWGEGSQQP